MNFVNHTQFGNSIFLALSDLIPLPWPFSRPPKKCPRTTPTTWKPRRRTWWPWSSRRAARPTIRHYTWSVATILAVLRGQVRPTQCTILSIFYHMDFTWNQFLPLFFRCRSYQPRHLWMPDVWPHRYPLLLYRMRSSLPQRARMQIEKNVADGILRLLGEM